MLVAEFGQYLSDDNGHEGHEKTEALMWPANAIATKQNGITLRSQ
jgi:hypothetical protein